MTKKIRVLVVDDSAFMRVLISDFLKSDPEIEVIAVARDGKDALEKVRKLRPDVITLDIQMPRMDGLSALCHIMSRHPTPTIMVSCMDKKDKDIVFKSLEHGATDFISKPRGRSHEKLSGMKRLLIEKVKTASRVNVKKLKSPPHKKKMYSAYHPNPDTGKYYTKKHDAAIKIIAIGASTGGPRALAEILKKFPQDIPAAIIVVQHMPPGFTGSFARRLNFLCKLNVKEAEDGDIIEPGNVYIAPGGLHLTVEKFNSKKNQICLNDGEPVNNVKPSIDVMMESIAKIYGRNTLGVILTGMGVDGTKGMAAIKEKNGKTIAEDESTCIVYGMPKSAIDNGVADKIFPITRIPKEIMNMLF